MVQWGLGVGIGSNSGVTHSAVGQCRVQWWCAWAKDAVGLGTRMPGIFGGHLGTWCSREVFCM